MNSRTRKNRIISKQKNRKIGFEMMNSQRKILRKKRTLRKRKIKRKSLKFGGSELREFNFTLPNIKYYYKEEKNTTKM